jgi:hypothetical protein
MVRERGSQRIRILPPDREREHTGQEPPMRLTLSVALATVLALVGCREVRTVSYTYTKPNYSQNQLLDDEQALKRTTGVRQVIPKIDDKNTARIEIILDEQNKAPGLRLIQDLGYQQARN